MRKEKYKIKSAQRACVHGFKFGDFSGADHIENENWNIYRDLYKRLQFGMIDVFYLGRGSRDNGNLFVFSRDTVYSSKGCGVVRLSVFWRKGSGHNAEFIPLSHHTFNSLADFRRYGLPCGWVCVGADWLKELKRGCA